MRAKREEQVGELWQRWDNGHGEEGNTGLGNEEQGWGVRIREGTGQAGHQEGGKNTWEL